MVNDWDMVDTVVSGRDVESTILRLNPSDTSDDNDVRNKQYRQRAVFFRIAGRTVNRMVGLVFTKWPILQTSEMLSYITKNIDGAGTSIYQQSQAVLKSVIAKGRAGILVDYPIVHGETTREDMAQFRYYATAQRFEPQQIINWSTMQVGANVQLKRVVLYDSVESDEGTIAIFRELAMENVGGEHVYVSREYRRGGQDDEWGLHSETWPVDGFGNRWNEIPFAFIGAETNQTTVDDIPILDLCKGNICHYRLHADYMDAAHFVGQPQGYISGVEDVKGFMEEYSSAGLYAGSRQYTILPPGGSLGYAAVPPNVLVKEAMDATRNDLMGMGAFYITPGSAVKTAAQAEGEQEEQHSILSLAASNVAEAYSKALQWMYRYMRIEIAGEEEVPVYDLRRDFIRGAADPNLITALWNLVMQGGMPRSDFWQALRKAEIIDPEKDDEAIKEELSGEKVDSGIGAITEQMDAEELSTEDTSEEDV